MLLFLTGMPGCGKSTISKELSSKLKLPRVDLDDEIVRSTGMSIEAIFQELGEDHFRKLEKLAVEKACQMEKGIISTGGGAPCFFDNLEKMNHAGTTIFLDVPVSELAKRISKQDPNRPMVKNMSIQELLEFLTSKREERLSFYLKSKVVVSGPRIKASQILEKIQGLSY